MALSLSTEFKGLPANDCYASLSDGHFNLSKESIIFSVAYRAEKGYEPFKWSSFECRHEIKGANPFEQAYLYLKTLPEFADATDC